MEPLLLDIINFLESNQLVQGDGIDSYRDFIPEEPDNLVALIEYKGDPAIPVDSTVHRSVQISVRNTDANLARQKAQDIFKLFMYKMDEAAKISFNQERWGQVYLRQPPFMYKRDENGRTYYCFNIGITTTIE